MVNAQEWLDRYYPKEVRNSIKKLCTERNLEGHLDLRDFVNLETLECSFNLITKLCITGLEQLKSIRCNDNQLTTFNYSDLNHDKIVELFINNNNLFEQDLSVFSKFYNLQYLHIGNDDEKKISYSIYNCFHGSLRSLQNLSKLRSLHISNTNISSDLQFLPNNIKEIYCQSHQVNTEMTKLQNLLESCKTEGEYGECYDFQKWKTGRSWADIHPDLDKYKRQWENRDFAYEEVKQWIEIGFEVDWQSVAEEWRNLGFSPQQAKEWIEVGAAGPTGYNFVDYLLKEGYTSEQVAKFKSKDAQEWIDFFYPSNKRGEITWVDASGRGLKNCLKLVGFFNLEKFYCHDNQLISLDVSDCQKLYSLNCVYNKLTTLILPKEKKKITEIWAFENQLNDLVILSQYRNLEKLYLNKNNFFGSLKPLQALDKLKYLIISDTNIDSGLELLPVNLEILYCKNCPKLESELKGYCLDSEYSSYDIKIWRKDYLAKSLETIKEETAKIGSLEEEILTLTKLIKQQKEKIVKAYLHFAPEKELLKEVIIAYLEYTKARKKGELSVKLRKNFENLRNELEEKAGEEFAEEIEIILNDCESLVTLELELESEIIKRKKLLEDAYQKVLSITVNINEKIEAGGNIYIANIIKGHADLNYNSYQQEPKLEEILKERNLSNEGFQEEQKNSVKLERNYELETISKIEKTLTIKREEPIIKISGAIPEKSIIGNTFAGNADFSHKQIINQQIKNIQGINIEGDNNTLTNPSVHDNTIETITYEEETELQTSIEASLPPKQLK